MQPSLSPKNIYICGSWRHKAEIERLTQELRLRGHQVLSFIENNRALGFGEALAEQNPRLGCSQ